MPERLPIDEDPNQRQAAVKAARAYMNALQTQDFDTAVAMSGYPFWLDRTIMPSADLLEKEYRRELDGDNELGRWKLLRARFYSREDMEIFAERLVKRLSDKNIPTEHFVVLQYEDQRGDRKRSENILLMMAFEEGQWRVYGLED